MINYTHYSAAPITELHDTHQTSEFKPIGLWVSDETDHGWGVFCDGNDFSLNDAYMYDVTLDMTDVLLISNPSDLLSFHHKYRTDSQAPSRCEYIRWVDVAEDYKGVVITPYQWSQRLDLIWYYAWDCASGCIWDVSAVTGLELQYQAKEING